LEQAERANRNLRQLAAGIAGLLGIALGSGGVFALAEAVSNSKDKAPAIAATGEKAEAITATGEKAQVVAGAVEMAQNLPFDTASALLNASIGIAAVLIVLSVVLALLLWQAFGIRRLAEDQADEHLERLIEAKADYFLPAHK
jgi:hypothetical protein